MLSIMNEIDSCLLLPLCVLYEIQNQIYQHLDVCLIIENCLLVGLDWVSTHDPIYFQHVTCSCIFHAYEFFHSYFQIVVVFYFLLSLSLSLTDRLHMAPKCKSTSARNADDRKSTLGGCFYIGNNFVSWMSKKQNSISLFIAEAEYIVAGSYCTQLLWMQTSP